MRGLLKVIVKTNPIQAKFQHFIEIIEPIYETINPAIRFRPNYRQLKADDVIILACMLMRNEERDGSETYFHQKLVSWGITVPERSRYNRRCRDLVLIMKFMRVTLLRQWVPPVTYEIIDSAPITLAATRRSNQAKVLTGFANKGYNATKQTYYYGFKLHAVMANQGYFLAWELTPASLDDRKAAEELLLTAPARQVLADGGYLSQPLKDRLATTFGIHLWTPLRKNMAAQTTVDTGFLKNQRRHIETNFNNLDTVGHFEHPGIRTMSGLESRLEALLLWHTIRVHEQLAAGKSGLRLGHY
ncbi:MAG: IS982 family transposase [Lentilactobacillus hilgardii]